MCRKLFTILILLGLSVGLFAAQGQQGDTQNQTPEAVRQESQPSQTNQNTSGEAQEETPVDLGTIVVGATPYGTRLNNLPYNVTVITRQQIENSNSINITQAIGNAVGIINQNLGGFESKSSIRLRGGGTNETAVLINGIRMINNFDGGAYLGEFGAELFESIEIMRGNGSVLYGEGASYGVINLNTRNIRPGTHATVGALFGGGGIQGLFKFYTNASHGAKTFHVMGSASYLEQGAIKIAEVDSSLAAVLKDEVKENSDAVISNIFLSFGFNNEAKTIYSDFTAIVTSKNIGSPGSDQSPDPDNRFKQKTYITSLVTGIKLGDFAEIKIDGFFTHTKYEDYNISPATYDIFRYDRYGFNLTGIIKPMKKFIVTVGTGIEWERFHKDEEISTWPSGDLGPFRTYNLNAYTHVDYSIWIFQFMAGVRIDKHKSNDESKRQSFGTMVSAQAGVLVHVLNELLKVRGQVSRAYNVPSVLFTSWPGYENLDLIPIKYACYEAGLQSEMKKFYTTKVTFYYYRYWDTKVGSVSNGKQSSQGIEFELAVTPIDSLDLPVSIRIPFSLWIQKTKNLRDDTIVRLRKPKFMINFGIEGIVKSIGLTVGIYGQYRQNYDNKTAGFSNYPDWYLSYFIMDLKVNWRVKVSKTELRLFASLLNVFNKKYAIDGKVDGMGTSSYTMPGRTFIMGLEARF